MSKFKPRIYKGTRDFLPEQMIKRNFVIDRIKQVFEIYGFEPLETPTLELWETLSGKYGEEGDRLTYRFIDRGKREVGLRYDLTVPFSRVIAMYPEIPKPFKRYQIQPVWRADKPQKGRFREFYQCDIDIVGTPSMLADAEIIAVMHQSLQALGFNQFTIRINSRKIISSLVEFSGAGKEKELGVSRAIDKMDKIGLEGVAQELTDRKISNDAVNKILEVLAISGNNKEKLKEISKYLAVNPAGEAGIQEITNLFNYLEQYQIPENKLLFDLYLARGLDYYTGPIYETIIEEPRIGSLTGGGRYDQLIGLFSGQEQPATGSSLGLERIITVMDELNMFPEALRTSTQVLVTVFDNTTLEYSLRIINLLRRANINSDIYSGTSKLRGQIGLANDKGIPVVVIAGSNEIEKKMVTVKMMKTGDQKTISLSKLSEFLQKI